ncbi:Protein GLUTAMINE DUMPER 1 [Hibiscus syriacus]|uniref:Protein GLUTAMINE DUMPER 1 n=1 Tax=Hibiscus syriacus TaxID=106335 RepID=A0A6A3B0V5_HIBSY|nr:Protein GLUTAMINE DUMPER 1 [Hibiscus syriacus]
MAARAPYNATARTHSEVDSSIHPSPWHSPVPYLFGGLAAMLGLIAFALLILACSYWKLSGYLEEEESSVEAERDLEGGEGKGGDDARLRPVLEPEGDELVGDGAGGDRRESTETQRSSSRQDL